MSNDLVFLPLGGCGEIGMNLYLYGFGPATDRTWLMVDLGIKFGDERDPGVDVVLPDIRFIEEERKNLAGILLTHAHEDHFGAISYLWPRLGVPVYATPFTANLLRRKLSEVGLLEAVPLHEVDLEAHFEIGPFDIELVNVTHSIPEPCAVIIRTELGTVLHTGDWKIDENPVIGPHMNVERLRALGDAGCTAMMCDSTNVFRDGTSPSESDVAKGLEEVIAAARNRVGVTTFASNVGRILSVARATRAAGRELVVVGRAMGNVIGAARDTGYLPDFPETAEPEDFGYLPRDKVVCLCTGSQGERRAALSRIAEGSHRDIAFERNDMVVFSSRTIPGNEKAVGRTQNLLAAAGVDVVTAEEALVHVTGHPRRGELQQMYEWVRPDLLVPMHGEPRHLHEHENFAKSCGIAASFVVLNGEMARLAPEPRQIVDEAPIGIMHVDGDVIVPGEDGPARERRKMSFSGHVSVSVVIAANGKDFHEPRVRLRGIPEYAAEDVALEDVVLDVVEDVLEEATTAQRRDEDFVEEVVYRAVRRAVEMHWGKKPICSVLVTHV